MQAGDKHHRHVSHLYGLYPVDQQWRLNLAAILLVGGMIRLFVSRFQPELWWALGLAVVYPFLAYWLFRGGWGLQPVETALWGGLFITLVIAITGIVASFPLGILLALGRRSKLPIIKALSVTFIEVVRGVPLVSVLFMASNDPHNVVNVGDTTAVYHVINWHSPGMLKPASKP